MRLSAAAAADDDDDNNDSGGGRDLRCVVTSSALLRCGPTRTLKCRSFHLLFGSTLVALP